MKIRQYALLDAKRRVLEEVRHFIMAQTDIIQRVRETNASLNDTTVLTRKIQAVTAGVTKTEITGEEWKEELGAFVLYLKCSVTVETGDVEQRIAETLRDRKKTEDYTRLLAEVERLQQEMSDLRSRLAFATPAAVEQFDEERQALVTEITANEWFEKGLTSADLNTKISAFSEAIRLQPNDSWLYVYWGIAYEYKFLHDQAKTDYDLAIEIDPNNAVAYASRGVLFSNAQLYEIAVYNFNKAILNDSSQSGYYSLQADAYFGLKRYDMTISDCNHAITLDPNNAIYYRLRGAAYSDKGLFEA